jgi:hypothetical protein
MGANPRSMLQPPSPLRFQPTGARTPPPQPGAFLPSARAVRAAPSSRPTGRLRDASGTNPGTDAKSRSPMFTGLGTMGRLYTPNIPPPLLARFTLCPAAHPSRQIKLNLPQSPQNLDTLPRSGRQPGGKFALRLGSMPQSATSADQTRVTKAPRPKPGQSWPSTCRAWAGRRRVWPRGQRPARQSWRLSPG